MEWVGSILTWGSMVYFLRLGLSFSGVVCGSLWKMVSLSQSRSSVVLPTPSPRISQAVSMALRKPRPIPVPVGQNGCGVCIS